MKTLASFAAPAIVSNFVSPATSQVVETTALRSYAFTYTLSAAVVLVASLGEVAWRLVGLQHPGCLGWC
jgi:hypothetical protein